MSIGKTSLSKKGFSLVELLIGIALFSIIATGIYSAFTSVLKVIAISRTKVVAMDLANERFELIRNLPYADVGISGSVPNGILSRSETFLQSGYTFNATTTIRNTDDPFDGTIGGSPNDLSPADYRLVEIEIGCPTCQDFQPVFVNTTVAPRSLETESTNGALFVRVIDANGQPVPDAEVSILNDQGSTPILIEDTTNASGVLQIVDAPPGVNAYEITVTKSGYTTDRTYTPGAVGNPNPTKPHATVVLQQVTQVTFIIDRVSTLSFNTATQTCIPVGSVDFDLAGSKLIGASPDVLKYSQSQVTNGSGNRTLSGMEWDNYSVNLTDSSYELVGMNPVPPISLLPDSTQNVQLAVASKDPMRLLVVVKDAATQLPLASTTVELFRSGFQEILVTDRGYISQTDWSGGGGQSTSTDVARYFSSSNISNNSPAGEIKLNGSFGVYDSAGELVSSTFDTGSSSNFHQLFWLPTDQPPASGADSVRVQIATNNDGGNWSFLGPDGTSGSYYTSAISNINSVHDGDRYLRYKVFLSTSDTTFTPNISDVSFTFTSDCVPPGQVSFSGLAGGNYDLTVSRPGYQTQDISINMSSNWQQQEVLLSPM